MLYQDICHLVTYMLYQDICYLDVISRHLSPTCYKTFVIYILYQEEICHLVTYMLHDICHVVTYVLYQDTVK